MFAQTGIQNADALLRSWITSVKPLFDLSSDITLCLSISYQIIELNHVAAEYYQWHRADVIGQDYIKLCCTEACSLPLIEHLLASSKKVTFVLSPKIIVVKSKLHFFSVKWSYFYLTTQQSEVYGIVIVGKLVHDLEEQELFNQNLQETIIDSIPGSVYWKDKNGKYLGCNKVVVKKGNLTSKADIIGKTDYDLWPDMAENLRQKDLEVMQLGTTIQAEENVILPTGVRLWFASIKTPLRDSHGEVIGVVGNSLEITQLKEAQEKAQLANRAKTEFLAVASHELRVPLSSILAIASMLVEGGISDNDIKEYGKVILDSGTYLLSNINSILDFAKLEADKFELKPLPMDLRSHIEDVVNILKTFAEHKGLALNVSFPSHVPSKIISDSRALRQVLVNLVNNAIRFTDTGRVLIKVGYLAASAETAKILITIEDTGIGIPPEKLSAIFEDFAQVEDAYKRKSSRSGLGLGLSVVKRLVEILNGEIVLTSTLGKGSIFSLTFNFQLQDASTQRIPWLTYASNAKILIVSDTGNAEVICSHANAAVCESVTSDKAYAVLLSAQLMGQSYDILIIDNELLYKQPVELLAEINTHKTLKKPLSILLIAHSSVAEKIQAIKNGFFATISKPIQPMAFQNAITAAWEQWIEIRNHFD